MSNDYINSFVIFASSIGFFYNTAKKFKDDAIFLKKNTDTCTPSFHLLSSLAIELLPKVLIALNICLKYKDKKSQEISQDDLIKEISKEMNKFGHNLEKLYKNFPDLMNYLGVKGIEEYPPKTIVIKRDYFVWQYNFTLINLVNPIMIKNIEAIRYGVFANKPDVATNCVDDNKIIDFLEKLDSYVNQKKEEAKDALIGD
jgi:hypothetical protein